MDKYSMVQQYKSKIDSDDGCCFYCTHIAVWFIQYGNTEKRNTKINPSAASFGGIKGITYGF
jgi:hypothetical protein